MAFYVSPGVYPVETDLSTIVPTVSTTVAALVGYAKKGSTSVQLITNSQDFIREYGEPEATMYFHHTALAFLEQGSQLYCLRVVNGALYPGVSIVDVSAVGVNTGIGVGQATPVFYDQSGLADELFSLFAKDPGLWGNSLKIILKNVKDGTELEPTEQYTFEIDVYLTDAEGTTAKVENWKVSRKTKVDGAGRQMYLETKINGYSNYIVVADSTRADTIVPKAQAVQLALDGGVDGSIPTASLIAGTTGAGTGWFAFENPDEIDVRILIDGGYPSSFVAADYVTVQTAIKAVAESRLDCIGILSVPYADSATVALTSTYRSTTQNFNSSYTALYSPWCRINDPYNDQLIYVPPSGYVAAQIAFNDRVAQPWSAPAGLNRGLMNVVSLNKIYTQGERDSLYPINVNPLQVFRGEGTVIWGQKTQQTKASALDRVNVRRLLIVIEKSLSVSLRTFVFELNNDLTRLKITGMIESYMEQLASQGAFQTEVDDGYLVVCDETNNTAATIDANELHVDVFIRPVRSAEFIKLQTIITNTGASFDELISRGALL